MSGRRIRCYVSLLFVVFFFFFFQSNNYNSVFSVVKFGLCMCLLWLFTDFNFLMFGLLF